MAALSARAYYRLTTASTWEEIWEAGPYYERLSELLEDAQHYAIIAGWQIDSRLPLPIPARPGASSPDRPSETLLAKVLRTCRSKPHFHFYFLMWDHSYLYVPERELWQGRIWDTVHPRVHFIFDNRHPLGCAHHEKICILDGKTALCGGIDLCSDRWDSREHLYRDPRRSLSRREDNHGPYHDLGVQLTGPVCGELQSHLERRWRALSSVPFPPSPPQRLRPGSGHRVYLSRTQSDADFTGKRPFLVREIEFLFRSLIASAQKRLILEGQYFWSRGIASMLCAKMHQMRGRGFEIFLILAELGKVRSFTRKMASYEMTLIGSLQEAARLSGTRLVVGAPFVHHAGGDPLRPPKPVYIHSKLLIADDRYLCVGSANFASRALRLDSEISLTLEARTPAERTHIRRVSQAVLSHWNISESHARVSPGALRLHPLVPRFSLQEKPVFRPWRALVPYQRFFDPPLPWTYRLKWRLYRTGRRYPWAAAGLAALASGGITLAAIRPWVPLDSWTTFYAMLLSAAWIAPVPFFWAALGASLQLGASAGSHLAIASACTAMFFGYQAGRLFPAACRRIIAPSATRLLSGHLGQRSFESVLRVLADPRIEFRAKTAYQGIYCIPLPWFLLASWIVLPAAYGLTCRWIADWAPFEVTAALRRDPVVLAGALLGWVMFRSQRQGAEPRSED